jgi:hypothetical protein
MQPTLSSSLSDCATYRSKHAVHRAPAMASIQTAMAARGKTAAPVIDTERLLLRGLPQRSIFARVAWANRGTDQNISPLLRMRSRPSGLPLFRQNASGFADAAGVYRPRRARTFVPAPHDSMADYTLWGDEATQRRPSTVSHAWEVHKSSSRATLSALLVSVRFQVPAATKTKRKATESRLSEIRNFVQKKRIRNGHCHHSSHLV